MSYTNIPKPTGTNYTQVNSQGKEGFNDAAVTFDAFGTYFDGINDAAWSDVNKPTTNSWSNVAKPT